MPRVKLFYRRVDYYLQIFQCTCVCCVCYCACVCVCVCNVVGWQFACGYAQISLLSVLKSYAKGRRRARCTGWQLPAPRPERERERERAKQINKPDNNTKNLQKNNSVAAVAAAAACRFLYLSQQQQQKLAAKCKIMKNYRLSFAMSCGDDCGMH